MKIVTYIALIVVLFTPYISIAAGGGSASKKKPKGIEYTEEERRQIEEKTKKTKLSNALRGLEHSSGNHFEDSVSFFEIEGREMVEPLIKKLRKSSTSLHTRMNIIYVFGRMGKEGRSALSAIIPYMRHKDADMRMVAANAVGMFGKDSAEAVPHLYRLLFDESENVRRSAHRSLKKINTLGARNAIKKFNMNKRD